MSDCKGPLLENPPVSCHVRNKHARPPRRRCVLSLRSPAALSSPPALPVTRKHRNRRPPSAAAAGKNRGRLLIDVDQFRYEFLERFGTVAQHGIRLCSAKAVLDERQIHHLPTRPRRSQQDVGPVVDRRERISPVVRNASEGEGGRRIFSITVKSDSLKAKHEAGASPTHARLRSRRERRRNGRPKSSASRQDRSAMRGGRPPRMKWMSAREGAMVSSTYYLTALPCGSHLQSRGPSNKYVGRAGTGCCGRSVRARAGADDAEWERA